MTSELSVADYIAPSRGSSDDDDDDDFNFFCYPSNQDPRTDDDCWHYQDSVAGQESRFAKAFRKAIYKTDINDQLVMRDVPVLAVCLFYKLPLCTLLAGPCLLWWLTKPIVKGATSCVKPLITLKVF